MNRSETLTRFVTRHRVLFSFAGLQRLYPARIIIRAALLFALFASEKVNASAPSAAHNPLALPVPGAHALRILSPTVLELEAITRGESPATEPDFSRVIVSGNALATTAARKFRVTVEGRELPVQAIGFKRRPLYAPLKKRDLRVGNYLYVQLAEPVPEKIAVVVTNPSDDLWTSREIFSAVADPQRLSPALHVNQVGYLPDQTKIARVGYYLGSLGELEVPADAGFQLVEHGSGKKVFAGSLIRRPDRGFPASAYQQVWEADFTAFAAPGEYRLVVAGLGSSFPFLIDEQIAAAFARTYALGLYHQRCGTRNALPFTRFVHDNCHTAPAEIPTEFSQPTEAFLRDAADGYAANPRHTAPPLVNVRTGLYPFVQRGKIDVSGGHHDAGDYGKYTTNSALLIHHLVFAVDVFPGVGDLDNLGIPESGDGKSDLLQEARWEAEFLLKMQDTDGGFYFLVYPRDRKYEDDVLPDRGDPQVVWPKNTTATASAVAALAQCASSPRWQRQFPEDAGRYLQAARRGWDFLTQAIARHGRDGAYQKLTHYGNEFMHDDELTWAAAELFLATREKSFHVQLLEWFKPGNAGTHMWGWRRMAEGYGCATRSYAFALAAGKVSPSELNPHFLQRCEMEIEAGAEDGFRAAQDSAYGTSFPVITKQQMNAGWYFSLDQGFDLAVAHQLVYPPLQDRRPDFLRALLSNLDYEAGANPLNVCFVSGLGWRRQREIVHQYAQNDRRALPPSGLPLGNLQSGFGWLKPYGQELDPLCFPSDRRAQAPYPLYDRWSDSFNVATEFVISTQARALAATAFLMARSADVKKAWQPLSGKITGLPSQGAMEQSITAQLEVDGRDLRTARVLWEARDQEPAFGPRFTFTPKNAGEQWVEVEAQWPDGRRVFATADFSVR